MAYTDLTSLLKAIANSIRSKTSTTAAINAQDFPSKIDSIKVGITPSGTKSITSNGTYDVTNYASANVNVPQNVTVLWSAMNNIGSISDWNVPSGLSVSKNSANELVISKPASGSSYTMSYKTKLSKSYKGFGVLMYGNKTSAWYVGFNLQIAGSTVFSQNFDSGDSTKGVNISSRSSSAGASVSITLNTQNNYDSNNSGSFRLLELYLI